MRIFVTGADGMVSTSLLPLLRRDHQVEGVALVDGDICDRFFLRGRIDAFKPEMVVHLAAMTAVDRCEADFDEAFRVNAEGTRTAAAEAERVGARFLTLSTDYVFSGDGSEPYKEEDAPQPLSVYGQSKLAGEEAAKAASTQWTIVRTAWLFGPGGANFIDTMIALARDRDEVRVVDDQTGSPTYTVHLANVLAVMVSRKEQGLYHVVNRGQATWFELAREAVRLAGLPPERIKPTDTATFARPAPRPAFSVLDSSKAGRLGYSLPDWREGLEQYIRNRAAVAKEER